MRGTAPELKPNRILDVIDEKNSNVPTTNYLPSKARFIRRISAVSNAIETIDNEANHLIIYCLNCIRHGRNATYERGLTESRCCTRTGVQRVAKIQSRMLKFLVINWKVVNCCFFFL